MTNSNKKFNIILDLDQTVISGEPTDEFDFKNNIKKQNKFKFEPMEDYYIIFERPHLQKFLDFIFKNFNVSIWTAASKDYALFIIEKILLRSKKNRKIDYIFFSYHCSVSKKLKKKETKSLSILWDFYKIKGYNQNNTFILDDYHEDVYSNQKSNCILAPPFEFTHDDSDQDKFLKNLIIDLETILKDNDLQNNIRKINEKNSLIYKNLKV
jgi:hypothetical protein